MDEQSKQPEPHTFLTKSIGAQKSQTQWIELLKSESLMRFIIDSALDAIIAADHQGRVIEYNPASEKIFGFTRKEILGKKFKDLIIPEQFRKFHEKSWGDHLKTGKKHILNKRVELTAIRKNKEEFPVELTVVELRWDQTPFFAAFIRDITNQKKAEKRILKANEELKTLNQLRSDFIIMMSHELKTPLTSIQEGIGLILDEVDGPINKEQESTLEIVRDNIKRLSNLIQNVLTFYKIESGQIKVLYQWTDIKKLAQEICHLMKPAVKKKGIQFECHYPKDKIEMECDSDKIMQVFINLIDNAIKYTPPNGKITMHLYQENNKVVFDLTDTGIGIKTEDQEKIFDMFEQSKKKGMWPSQGAGVGLAICKKFIEQHNGKILVESEYKKGAKFTVMLPMVRFA